jgi:hypothetical protein
MIRNFWIKEFSVVRFLFLEVDTTEYLGGGEMKTGYPVIIVVVEMKIIVKQVFISPAKENEFVL